MSNKGGHEKRRDALPASTIAAVDGASLFDQALYTLVQHTQQAQVDTAGAGFADRLALMKVTADAPPLEPTNGALDAAQHKACAQPFAAKDPLSKSWEKVTSP